MNSFCLDLRTLCLLIAGMLPLSSQADPGITGAGFESDIAETAWKMPSRSFAIDGETARSGDSSLRWSNQDPPQYDLATQGVSLSMEHEYRLRGWVRTQEVEGDGATLAIEFFAGDHFLGGMYPPGVRGTQNWTPVVSDTFILPQEATRARVVCYARRGTTGRAWFDDLEIVRVPDPPFRSVLTFPRYRGWIWEDGPRRVEVKVETSLSDAVGMKAWLTVFDRDGKAVAYASRSLPESGSVTLQVDAEDWPVGAYVAAVALRNDVGVSVHHAKHDLVVKAADAKPTVYIDDHNRLIVRGQPVMPIGVYARKGLPQQTLDRLEGTPFNLVMPYSDPNRDELDRAQAAGVMVMASVKDYYAGSKFAPAGIETRADEIRWFRPLVWELRDHPALLGWYLNDELPPSFIDQAATHQRWIEEDDPNHPTWTVLQRPHQVGRYLRTFDVIGTDPYPLPNKPIRTVTQWTERTRHEVEHAGSAHFPGRVFALGCWGGPHGGGLR